VTRIGEYCDDALNAALPVDGTGKSDRLVSRSEGGIATDLLGNKVPKITNASDVGAECRR
jgi:hypothetical protein